MTWGCAVNLTSGPSLSDKSLLAAFQLHYSHVILTMVPLTEHQLCARLWLNLTWVSQSTRDSIDAEPYTAPVQRKSGLRKCLIEILSQRALSSKLELLATILLLNEVGTLRRSPSCKSALEMPALSHGTMIMMNVYKIL